MGRKTNRIVYIKFKNKYMINYVMCQNIVFQMFLDLLILPLTIMLIKYLLPL